MCHKNQPKTPPGTNIILTSGEIHYGRFVSPLPQLGRMKGVTIKNHWAARKVIASGSQTLNGRLTLVARRRSSSKPHATIKLIGAAGGL